MTDPDVGLMEGQLIAALDQGVAGIDELLVKFRDHPEQLPENVQQAALKVNFVPRLEAARTKLVQAVEGRNGEQ